MALSNPYLLLKLNRLLKNHSVKCLGVLVADKLGLRHLSVRMDPFLGCNLRCQMCHFSSPEYMARKTEIMSAEDYSRVAELLFPKALQVILGTGAEPTVHPKLPAFVEIAKQRHGVPFVGISTNAQLLTCELAASLLDAGLDEITISMHGVRKEMYERLQPPASYEKLHRALASLTELSERGGRKFAVRVNFTTNPDNCRELADFFEVFGNYKIDTLQVRKIFDLGDTVYHDRDLDPCLGTLEATRLALQEKCAARKTTLLCPSFRKKSGDSNPLSSILLPLVHRSVWPGMVWKEDFDWRNETYEAYCRRKKWHRDLLRMAATRASVLQKEIQNGHRSLGYDVSG